jgi:hypothetical protein
MRVTLLLCVASMASALLMQPVVHRQVVPLRASVAMQQFVDGKYIAEGSWKIYPRDGADGTILTNYDLAPGQYQVVGLYDICPEYQAAAGVDGVAVEQAGIEVAPDGSSLTVHALGPQPTGWRTNPNEAWRWLNQGETAVLQSNWKVNLDYMNPENTVFKVRPNNNGSSNPV